MTLFYKPNKADYKAVIFTGTPLTHPKPNYNGRMFQGLAITEDGSRLIVGGPDGRSYEHIQTLPFRPTPVQYEYIIIMT